MAKKNNKWFSECATLTDLEEVYITLVMMYVNDAEKMKAINEEYDEAFTILKEVHNATAEDWAKVHEGSDEMRTVVEKILSFRDEEHDLDARRDLKIELCGTWLWIGAADGKPSDITRAYSKLLNRKSEGAGCNWSPKKLMWYWRSETGKKPWIPHKKGFSMEEIREKYSSRVITNADDVE